MVYHIEFIRQIDGKAEALALDVIRLVADEVTAVIQQADQLYRRFDTVPRPDGFRIRDNEGSIVHEYSPPQE